MRATVALIALLSLGTQASAQRTGYFLAGDSAGSGWAAALSAVGFRPSQASRAAIYIVRGGGKESARDLETLVADGVCVVLEGTSPAASQFGVTTTGETVIARRELDARDTEQVVLWEQPQRVPRMTVASALTVFSRERWNGAPLLVGARRGKGAVLWAAVSPGPSGFERLPYLAQALWDLGVKPSLVGNRLQMFFDYAYRTRADPRYLAAQWRRMGIARLFVSSWYFFERDAVRDKYLATLVDAAHRNGITVYAWLELPHVSQHFWEAHPEWREKNGLLSDALVDWRKNMNLLNPESSAAAASLVTGLLNAFDWDGVTLSELYFEGTRGLDAPTQMTPFNDDVRREVNARYGFDPGHLFDMSSPDYYGKNPRHMAEFREYRAELQRRLHEQWLDILVGVRRTKGSLGITVCYVDDVSEPAMRDLIGANVNSLIPLILSHDASLLVQDPFVLWGLGPARYLRIANEYKPLIAHERLGVDINIVARKVATFPARHQTGSELFQLVHTGASQFEYVSLYAENSILRPDLPLLPSSVAIANALDANADGTLTVESEHGVGIRWTGEARVDGVVWPYANAGVAWLPAGRHVVARSSDVPPIRVMDFGGNLDGLATSAGSVIVRYHSDSRAVLKLSGPVMDVMVDGQPATVTRLPVAHGETVILLPAGKHAAEVLVRR